jgi:hypothetical protein
MFSGNDRHWFKVAAETMIYEIESVIKSGGSAYGRPLLNPATKSEGLPTGRPMEMDTSC